MNDSDIFDLIPAYALGALSEEERIQVEGLLAKSPEARTELHSYTEMMVGMAALAPRQEAPARLNAEFKARLAKENRSVLITPFRALIGLAAVIVAMFGVYGLYRVVDANNRQQQINAIITNANAQRIPLDPQNGSTGTVQIVTAPDNANAVAVAQLPTLPSDHQYQVWMIVDNKPRSMGVFSANNIPENFLLDVPVSPDQIDFVLAITVEPAGGGELPTTSPIFVASVKQGTTLLPSFVLAG